MVDNVIAHSTQWDFIIASYVSILMVVIALIISVAAYWRVSKIERYFQTVAERVTKLRNLEKRTQLLETLHEERLLRLKMQLELLSISFQTSYVFRFASAEIRQQLSQHQAFFEQLEQLEKLSGECEVNSEKLYREAEIWGEETDPRAFEHLLSKANLFRNQAQNQLEIAKFVRSKLKLDKYT